MYHPKVIVICASCGKPARYSPPDGNNPYGSWDWHCNCPSCGAKNWTASEFGRDWKTGKLIEEIPR